MTVLVGYRLMPPAATCPFCRDAHGMLEMTDTRGTYRYRCWCGSSSLMTATDDELVTMFGVPADRLP